MGLLDQDFCILMGLVLCSWQPLGGVAHKSILALGMSHVNWQMGHGLPTFHVCHAGAQDS